MKVELSEWLLVEPQPDGSLDEKCYCTADDDGIIVEMLTIENPSVDSSIDLPSTYASPRVKFRYIQGMSKSGEIHRETFSQFVENKYFEKVEEK